MKPTPAKQPVDESKLKSENSYLKSKIDKLADELEENSRTIQNLQTNIGKNEGYSEELDEMRKIMISTEKELNTEKDQNKDLQATITKLESEILYLEKRGKCLIVRP